jgi:hypothetical protein
MLLVGHLIFKTFSSEFFEILETRGQTSGFSKPLKQPTI